MHVPVIMMLDKHYEQVDPDYEDETKLHKRWLMLAISFVVSLFFGAVPLFAWTPMTFEPSGMSCSVYQARTDLGYTSYIWATLIVYEIVPIMLVIILLVNAKRANKNESISLKVNDEKIRLGLVKNVSISFSFLFLFL